jgi:hypothetical protein
MSKEFLGIGWKFPVTVDSQTGKIRTSKHEEDINEAIRIILMTSPGERMYRPDFGCSIKKYVFGVTDTNTMTLIKHEVKSALLLWEPRIKDVEVDIDSHGGNRDFFDISISYVVRSTNNVYNKVFPFYLNEGVE